MTEPDSWCGCQPPCAPSPYTCVIDTDWCDTHNERAFDYDHCHTGSREADEQTYTVAQWGAHSLVDVAALADLTPQTIDALEKSHLRGALVMAREQGHMVVDSSQWTLQRHTDPLDPEHETWVVTGYVVDLGEKEES